MTLLFTLTPFAVAQATIDHIVRMVAQQAEVDSGPGPVCRWFKTTTISYPDQPQLAVQQAMLTTPREDMTLLIRTFSREEVAGDGGLEKRPAVKTLTTRSSARPPRWCWWWIWWWRRWWTLCRPTRSSTTTESSGVYLPLHGRELAVDEHGRIGGFLLAFHFDLIFQFWLWMSIAG